MLFKALIWNSVGLGLGRWWKPPLFHRYVDVNTSSAKRRPRLISCWLSWSCEELRPNTKWKSDSVPPLWKGGMNIYQGGSDGGRRGRGGWSKAQISFVLWERYIKRERQKDGEVKEGNNKGESDGASWERKGGRFVYTASFSCFNSVSQRIMSLNFMWDSINALSSARWGCNGLKIPRSVTIAWVPPHCLLLLQKNLTRGSLEHGAGNTAATKTELYVRSHHFNCCPHIPLGYVYTAGRCDSWR